jgi:hypothetical protein
MPVLMAYGYSKEDLERLVEDCVTLVRFSSGFGLMVVIGSRIYFLSTSFCGLCH